MLDLQDIEETFFGGNAESIIGNSPERKLLSAMILRAIADSLWSETFGLKDKRALNHKKAHRIEARNWLRSDSVEYGSFLWYLNLADFDIDLQKIVLEKCDSIEQQLQDKYKKEGGG